MLTDTIYRYIAAHPVNDNPQAFAIGQTNKDKNSSGDEIANVNFLRRYGTYVLQNTEKENLLRLTN